MSGVAYALLFIWEIEKIQTKHISYNSKNNYMKSISPKYKYYSFV